MVLLIGYGNTLRRDDGLGVRAAELLAADWQWRGGAVECRVAHQLTPELALDVADPAVDAVVFVDAAVGLGEPALQRIGPDPRGGDAHALQPGVLLTYADKLYGHRPAGWWIGLPAVDLEHGEGLSPAGEAALRAVQAQAETWWSAISLPPSRA